VGAVRDLRDLTVDLVAHVTLDLLVLPESTCLVLRDPLLIVHVGTPAGAQTSPFLDDQTWPAGGP
jgi:hypothetical protein